MDSSGFDPTPADDAPRSDRLASTRRITWIGLATNVALSVVKVVGGWLGHSQALVADGIHSLSDLITDVVVLLAARHAARGADRDHPYGHARIETAASVVVGLLLLLTAVLIGHHAVVSLGTASLLTRPLWITLGIALLSVAVKELLYRYTQAVARAIQSSLLHANAWHHRSDALSSIVVAIGLAGALAGTVSLDAVAALIVAVMIARVGADVIWRSLRELVDTGLDDEALARLRAEALSVTGVHRAHTFRSRWMGHRALLDLHIRVGGRISVSEGHRIAEAVRLRLLRHRHHLADVMVHVDPEDDTDGGPSNTLPLRDELCARLRARLPPGCPEECIEGMVLHYLAGKVHVEIALRPDGERDLAVEAEALRRALAAEPGVGDVSVHERLAPQRGNGSPHCTESVHGESPGRS